MHAHPPCCPFLAQPACCPFLTPVPMAGPAGASGGGSRPARSSEPEEEELAEDAVKEDTASARDPSTEPTTAEASDALGHGFMPSGSSHGEAGQMAGGLGHGYQTGCAHAPGGPSDPEKVERQHSARAPASSTPTTCNTTADRTIGLTFTTEEVDGGVTRSALATYTENTGLVASVARTQSTYVPPAEAVRTI